MKPSMSRWKKLAGMIPFLLLFSAGIIQGRSGPSEGYAALIEKISSRYELPADLIHAIIRAESDYDSRAVSIKGAAGLMQLMPETAKQYGVNDVFDPQENLEGGAKYLKDLVRLYDGHRDLVLAAYNAGQEAIKKFNGIPPYPETKAYIRTIQASYPSPLIRVRATIYKYYDQNGCLCFSTKSQAPAGRN